MTPRGSTVHYISDMMPQHYKKDAIWLHYTSDITLHIAYCTVPVILYKWQICNNIQIITLHHSSICAQRTPYCITVHMKPFYSSNIKPRHDKRYPYCNTIHVNTTLQHCKDPTCNTIKNTIQEQYTHDTLSREREKKNRFDKGWEESKNRRAELIKNEERKNKRK